MFDRSSDIGQAMEADGHHPRRFQVTRRCQLLTSNDIFMVNAGQIDGRPHASVDFVDRRVVVLKRADSHPFTHWQPFELVTNPNTAGGHRAGDHGTVALNYERAVDAPAEPFLAGTGFKVPAGFSNGRLKLVDAFARLGGSSDNRGVF